MIWNQIRNHDDNSNKIIVQKKVEIFNTITIGLKMEVQ